MNTIITINRASGIVIGVTLSLIAMIGASHASEATAAQRAACTPDAFRLCSSDIPNVAAVTACMIKNKPNLSTACKSVFGK
jgi:hypothetical protein